jgi:predicted enzyme related to lactoylglutathione lyase
MATKIGLVLDCVDPTALADFWSKALGYTTLGGAGSYVLLVDETGRQPKLLLQGVPEGKVGKNRMHLDIEVGDIETEAARLEAIGARRVAAEQMHEHGTSWVLMTDPEGNEFCVCDGGQGTGSP